MLSRRSETSGRAPDDDGDEVDDPKKAVVYDRFDRSAGLHKGLQRLRQLPHDVAASLDAEDPRLEGTHAKLMRLARERIEA